MFIILVDDNIINWQNTCRTSSNSRVCWFLLCIILHLTNFPSFPLLPNVLTFLFILDVFCTGLPYIFSGKNGRFFPFTFIRFKNASCPSSILLPKFRLSEFPQALRQLPLVNIIDWCLQVQNVSAE